MNQKTNYELLISKIDSFIRKYYLNQLLRGVLSFAALILVVYLMLSLSEYKFYFSTGIRKFIAFAFSGLFLYSLIAWVGKPLFSYFRLGNSISHEQAAAIIGTHFSDVKDKLLNILQLKQQENSASNHALIEASIHQKINQIKLVPFTHAIDLGKNKKYLKYVLPPLAVLIFILFAAPSILKESNLRLVNPNKVFPKKAPFDFFLQNKKLKIPQFENLEVKVKVDGKALPKEVFIQTEGREYRMTKTTNDIYTYTFNNVQKDFDFNFLASGFPSVQYDVKVVAKPIITGVSAIVQYPAYTGKGTERIENTSDIFVPEGTSIRWDFKTENTDFFNIRVNKNIYPLSSGKKNHYSHNHRFLADASCAIMIGNKEMENMDSIVFNVQVSPDKNPIINVEKLVDSTDTDYMYFFGNASDDYGLSRLEFHYNIINEKGKVLSAKKVNLPYSKEQPFADFDYTFDASRIPLSPGDKIVYYFETWDNDGVHGPKMARSSVYALEKATKQELQQQEEKNNEEIKDHLTDAQKEVDQFSEKIDELKEKMLNKKVLDWQDKKAIEDLLKDHNQLTKALEEMKKDFQQNLNNQDKIKELDPEILQKQEKLEKLMDEMLSEEVKDMLKKLEELMNQFQKENSFEKLDEFQMSAEDLKTELEKLENLFKKLEFEAKVNEMVNKLEELAKKQEELSKETKEGNTPAEELKEKQEQLNQAFDKIQEELEKLQEKNKEQGSPLDMPKNEQQSQDIENEMQQSKENLQNNEKSKAGKSQKNAADKMKQMAQSMQAQMDAAAQQEDGEDMDKIRQLLENLVKFSFDQEKLMKELKVTQTESPKYIKIMADQQKLRDDMEMIKDSLIELSKRQFQIETFVKDEIHKLDREMKKTMKGLEDRNIAGTTSAQQFVMTSANNLALMLDESLQQMQQQMNQGKPGSGSCNKPGGTGMKEIQQMQKQLNEQLKKMQGEMKSGKTPKQMGKDFADAAQKQAEIREALRKLKESMSQEEKNGSGVDKLMEQMDKTEQDLANKKLTEEMLKRQQEIMTKMLDFDDAKRQQDQKDERQSESGKDIPRKIPPSIEEYLKKKKSEIELYKAAPPTLKPFYKNLVEKYFQNLN